MVTCTSAAQLILNAAPIVTYKCLLRRFVLLQTYLRLHLCHSCHPALDQLWCVACSTCILVPEMLCSAQMQLYLNSAAISTQS
jgi:hypothetical protein